MPQDSIAQVRRECPDCGSSFVSKAHLAIHVRTVHEKQRIHVCEFDNCGKTFGQRGSLSRHISAVHLRIKRHACPYDSCGKTFSERWTLSVHIVSVNTTLLSQTLSDVLVQGMRFSIPLQFQSTVTAFSGANSSSTSCFASLACLTWNRFW